jgi:hypothetical protein
MTTLYDPPAVKPKHNTYYLSDTEGDDTDEQVFEMADYDLDVVDDALLNPNSSQYLDHFGFMINVKTDDESSSDDDSEVSDHEAPVPTKPRSSSLSESDTFFRHPRPSSVTSIHSPIPRPSQSYQQRHKRYPDAYIGTPKSPTTNDRHFDKLASKFRRFSHNDHQYDSESHTMLKQEALHELNAYREKGGIQNNSINWGKKKHIAFVN